MSENSNVTASALIVMTTAVASFTSLIPPAYEVRKSVHDPKMMNDVRMGEALASTLVISIGVGASAFTRSMIPLLSALAATAVMVVMYETVLATPPKETTHV